MTKVWFYYIIYKFKSLQAYYFICFLYCTDETGRIGYSDLKKVFDSYGMYFDSDEKDLKALVSKTNW